MPELPPDQVPSFSEVLSEVFEARKGWYIASALSSVGLLLYSAVIDETFIVGAGVSMFASFFALFVWLPMLTRRRRKEIIRERHLAMFAEASKRLGGPAPEDVRSTFVGRLKQVVRSSRNAFVGGGVIGVSLCAWLGYAEGDYTLAFVLFLVWMFVMAGSAVFLAMMEAVRSDTKFGEGARAIAAYREATKDQMDLAGSLELGGDSGGGELTLGAESGGLGLSESASEDEVVFAQEDAEVEA